MYITCPKANQRRIKATASREQPKVSELVQPDILFDKLLNTVKGAANTTPAIPGTFDYFYTILNRFSLFMLSYIRAVYRNE
uniref:CSON001243 protein n=1 Tax=Culicoides sonorensis TaxID=179676 RepID=A0A336LQR3_CULSO